MFSSLRKENGRTTMQSYSVDAQPEERVVIESHRLPAPNRHNRGHDSSRHGLSTEILHDLPTHTHYNGPPPHTVVMSKEDRRIRPSSPASPDLSHLSTQELIILCRNLESALAAGQEICYRKSEMADIIHKEANLIWNNRQAVETPAEIRFCVYCGHFQPSSPLYTGNSVNPCHNESWRCDSCSLYKQEQCLDGKWFHGLASEWSLQQTAKLLEKSKKALNEVGDKEEEALQVGDKEEEAMQQRRRFKEDALLFSREDKKVTQNKKRAVFNGRLSSSLSVVISAPPEDHCKQLQRERSKPVQENAQEHVQEHMQEHDDVQDGDSYCAEGAPSAVHTPEDKDFSTIRGIIQDTESDLSDGSADVDLPLPRPLSSLSSLSCNPIGQVKTKTTLGVTANGFLDISFSYRAPQLAITLHNLSDIWNFTPNAVIAAHLRVKTGKVTVLKTKSQLEIIKNYSATFEWQQRCVCSLESSTVKIKVIQRQATLGLLKSKVHLGQVFVDIKALDLEEISEIYNVKYSLLPYQNMKMLSSQADAKEAFKSFLQARAQVNSSLCQSARSA